MNVSSLELSKELYSLSEWAATEYQYAVREDRATVPTLVRSEAGKSWPDGYWTAWPAYDLGYLINKLPPTLHLNTTDVKDLYIAKSADCYIADYRYRAPDEWAKGGGWWHRYDRAKDVEATTAEDAVCKLAIVLFKQRLLK